MPNGSRQADADASNVWPFRTIVSCFSLDLWFVNSLVWTDGKMTAPSVEDGQSDRRMDQRMNGAVVFFFSRALKGHGNQMFSSNIQNWIGFLWIFWEAAFSPVPVSGITWFPQLIGERKKQHEKISFQSKAKINTLRSSLSIRNWRADGSGKWKARNAKQQIIKFITWKFQKLYSDHSTAHSEMYIRQHFAPNMKSLTTQDTSSPCWRETVAGWAKNWFLRSHPLERARIWMNEMNVTSTRLALNRRTGAHSRKCTDILRKVSKIMANGSVL